MGCRPQSALARFPLACGLVAALLTPAIAAGHTVGQPFPDPLPPWLFAAAVAASILACLGVGAAVLRIGGRMPAYPRVALPALGSRVVGILVAILGMAWWYGAIVAGLLSDPRTMLPAVLAWIFVWSALPVFSALAGNPWPSFSPFRTSFWLLEGVARFFGFDRLDAGLRYPSRLGRLPAALLLFGAAWSALILPSAGEAPVVAGLLIGYTLVQLIGMGLFGRVAWLSNAELFEVLLGWFGRMGLIGRRAMDPALCADCAAGCNPDACVDCPECATAAGPEERQVELRPWFSGLTELDAAGWSDLVFLALVAAVAVTDGVRWTSGWGPIEATVKPLVGRFASGSAAPLMGGAAILLAAWLVAIALLAAAVLATRLLAGPDGMRRTIRASAGVHAALLLPPIAGLLLAHNLTLVVTGAGWLPLLLRDPAAAAPAIEPIPATAVWMISLTAIAIGATAAVFLAARLALRNSPGHPLRTTLPLAALSLAYAVAGLVILALPVTLPAGTS